MVELRPYQDELVAGIRAQFVRHRRVLAVAPTGSGKTVTFAYITSNAAAKGNSVIVAAHRAEIVDQISGALTEMGVRHGLIRPGHTLTQDQVHVAMIQTLSKRLHLIAPPSLLVIDEAHHSITKTYSTVCDAWPTTRILGVTATPQRLDGKGLDAAFDEMVIGPGTAELIAAGYLAKYRYLAPPQLADFSDVKTRLGDYALDELAEVMDRATITGDAVIHFKNHLHGRPAIAFCVTVKHAEHVAEQFQAAGYRAASVDGSMSKAERRDRIEGIGNGRYQVLTSCELISEGVDVPVTSGAILLRPTKSLAMFLQQIGRVLRPKPDGGDAIILDHVGNFHKFGMPDAPREWSLKTKKNPVPGIKICESCYRVFPSGPKWKEGAECAHWPVPSECILVPAERDEAEGKKPPETVDGTLEIVTNSPEWAAGKDVLRLPYKEALRLARTDDQVRELGRLRGFKPGWAHHIIMKRRERYAEVPFVPPPPPTNVPPPPAETEPSDEWAEIMAR